MWDVTPRRRKLDWIQFGILLCAVLTLFVYIAESHGRIMAIEEYQKAAIEDVQRRLATLESKWDRFQATQSPAH